MKPVISTAVLQEARWAGLYGDLNARIGRMIKRSVPVPGDKTRRRFFGWELKFDQNVIIGIARID